MGAPILVMSLLALLLQSGSAMWTPPALKYSPPSSTEFTLLTLFRSLVRTHNGTFLAPDDSCFPAVIALITSPFSTPASTSLIMNSGKKLNDLGNYPACKKSPGSRYILAGVTLGEFFMRIGLCLPSVCTPEDFVPYKSVVAAIFGGATGMDLSENSVLFMDVAEENRVLSETGAGYYGFWIFTGLVVTISILATTLDLHDMFKPYQGPEAETGAAAGVMKAVSCFSFRRSFTGFFKTANPIDPNLETFSGLRVIAMLWIIIGHTNESEIMSPTFNINKFFDDFLHKYQYAYVKSGTLGVDAFYLISGFFAACTFFSLFKNPDARNVKTVLLSYVHRYFRLLPVLLFTIVFVTFLIPVMKDQPFNPYMKQQIENCKKSWYLDLLYVANLGKLDDVCVDWNWYIMTDFQYFLLAPFVVLFFLCRYLYGFLALGVLATVSIVWTAITYSHYGLHTSLAKPQGDDYYSIYYIRPWCRVVPYLMGMAFYVLYKENKKKPEEQHLIAAKLAQLVSGSGKYAVYAFGIALLHFSMTTIYYFDNNTESWGQGLATTFEIVFRPAFILGVMCMIYPALIGKGEVISTIMGYPVFNPIGKLVYGTYMIQLALVQLLLEYTLSGHYFNSTWVWMNFFILASTSYTLSFAVTILYESPTVALLRTFLNRSGAPKKLEATKGDSADTTVNCSLASSEPKTGAQ